MTDRARCVRKVGGEERMHSSDQRAMWKDASVQGVGLVLCSRL